MVDDKHPLVAGNWLAHPEVNCANKLKVILKVRLLRSDPGVGVANG
jgi:hypothetical protein